MRPVVAYLLIGGLVLGVLLWKSLIPSRVKISTLGLKEQQIAQKWLNPASTPSLEIETHAATTDVIRVEESRTAQAEKITGSDKSMLSPADRVEMPAGTRAVSGLANRGKATAHAAFETFAWAAVNRETDIGAGIVGISWWKTDDSSVDDDAARWAQYWLTLLPEPMRSEIQTPQRLVATMHENEVSGYVGYSIINHEALSAQTELINVRWYSAEGSSKDEQFIMRYTPSGWVRETHPFLISRIARQLSGRQ